VIAGDGAADESNAERGILEPVAHFVFVGNAFFVLVDFAGLEGGSFGAVATNWDDGFTDSDVGRERLGGVSVACVQAAPRSWFEHPGDVAGQW
jgi:hypothetical protein